MRSRRQWLGLLLAYLSATCVYSNTSTAFVGLSIRSSGSSSSSPRVACSRRHSSSATTADNNTTSSSVLALLDQGKIQQISDLVLARAEARRIGDYEKADALREKINQLSFLPEHGLQIRLQDIPRTEGGGSTWTIENETSSSACLPPGPTVLQLAHAALGLALDCSERRVPVPHETLNGLVSQAKERLQKATAVEAELGGRKAADAAFWLALAGVTDDGLFEDLTTISTKELERFGNRSSCRAKDVLQILGRLSAAGIRNRPDLEQHAEALLKSKGSFPSSDSLLNFHSDRCLLMLWKFSARQRKQRTFLQAAMNHWASQKKETVVEIFQRKPLGTPFEKRHIEWSSLYDDASRPLVIDCGCGMGVSLLGLAQSTGNDSSPLLGDSSQLNFAGVDLNGLAISYARGLAKRWSLDSRLHFFQDNAERFLLQVLDSYPGPIQLCLIQFPTPYRLPNKDKENRGGNSQLPPSVTNGFMVTRELLHLIRRALQRTPSNNNAKLLLQSNCEDVAAWMKNAACNGCGFRVDTTFCDDHDSQEEEHTPDQRTPKRTLDWIAMGGERAVGEGWCQKPVLPRLGRTETEVACTLNKTPVHRCILTVEDQIEAPCL
jgi:tRNA G46 methylase TrmB